MAGALYDRSREKFLNGDLSWRDDTFTAVLVDTNDYAVDLANHEFLSDIPVAARVATTTPLTGKLSTAGIADADNAVWPQVSGDTSEALVIVRDTGTDTTSELITYQDTGSGLPVIPNGGDINISWSENPERIFKL